MESTQTSEILSLVNVRVNYGYRTAIEGFNLQLNAGTSLGLLGANGAGKTTTIRAVLGMVRPREGSIRVLGSKPGNTESFCNIGFAPEEGSPPDFLTGEEYLNFVGRLKIRDKERRKKEIGELLNWFELVPTKYIREYSKGMKRRVVLAQSFLGNPRLLILDEPLNGLDPLMIIKLREGLETYRSGGGTMLYSSHILSEVERTCTDVCILHKGILRYSASMDTVKSEHGSVEGAFSRFVS